MFIITLRAIANALANCTISQSYYITKQKYLTHLGKHIILEFHQCTTDLLKDPEATQSTLEAAAIAMGATIVSSSFHHFSPLGVSGVVIIMESHLTIHTWPEYNYAAVDIFTCGVLDFEKAIEVLVERLGAKEVEEKSFERGRLPKGRPEGK